MNPQATCMTCDHWHICDRCDGWCTLLNKLTEDIDHCKKHVPVKIEPIDKLKNPPQVKDKLMNDKEFIPFPKMPRLQRTVIISEKIDGTNAQVYITDDGKIRFGSRTRWITPEADNFGFARWATDHKEELLKLGPGRHFGEWWGRGIQRHYGLKERRFSLFNVTRWCPHGEVPKAIPTADPRNVKMQDMLPSCCHLVPVLRCGINLTTIADSALYELSQRGSLAAPGFPRPEGIVVFHVAGNVGFKMTLDNDGVPKSSLK